MNPPDLKALQRCDADGWDDAFHWLWPTAFSVAQLKLQTLLPDDVEDVAIEALEELVEKVREVKSVEELKPLTASVAHHRSVSRLRARFAKKRGEGRTESIDAPAQDAGPGVEPQCDDGPLMELDQAELAGLLRQLQAELKADHRAILDDFFLHGLAYEEIARKQGVAIGTVGVYLKRGLEAIRRAGARHPKLLKELEAFLR